MLPLFFDSRDPSCKKPYGAVPCGTQISIALRPSPAEGLLDCTLLLYAEFADQRWEISLLLSMGEDGLPRFSGTYAAPEDPDLVWYAFRFHRGSETRFLGRNGLCLQADDLQAWQQTVYDPSFAVPDWFGRGVTYQIFPDRFRRAEVPVPRAMLGNRILHESWNEDMSFLSNRDGETQNYDYFGGNLAGIEEALPYLKSLGVSTLYLCPIFEADSNHRYNTGDYETIDPMLGTEEDFRRLCRKAKGMGIHVMLDGVFNHTGSNSRYFNAQGSYSSVGAAQSQGSFYYPWYTFQKWPDQYNCWWGVHTLPAVNESHPDYIDYIVEGKDSIVRRWLRAGADAWRLDVADELPDSFIARIRAVMMEENPEAFLIGEVWEDGSNKIAYDRRRKYLLGREVHGLMNYPFRSAALAYLTGGSAEAFVDAMETLRENYPPAAFYSCMNLLGTHDTPRILTLLGTSPDAPPDRREDRARYRMTPEERQRGLELLRLGALLLFTFPGSPTIYYGDEAGMEGFEDPFNRGPYPWGQEDTSLQHVFSRLGKLRNSRPSLQTGMLQWLHAEGPLLAFARESDGERTVTILNTASESVPLTIPNSAPTVIDVLSGKNFLSASGSLSLQVPPVSGLMLI